MAGRRRQAILRGSLNYSNIAFEGPGSFLDYISKEIPIINENSKISVSNPSGSGVFKCLILEDFRNK